MAIVELPEFPACLPRRGALIGLDLGEKTIGVAACDASWSVASPVELIRKTRFTDEALRLFQIMDARKVMGMVVGLPVNMDGTEGKRCQSNRAFARNLLRLNPDLIIAFWDERMSSMAINRMLIDEFDTTRARRADLVDKMAAAWILQGAIDRLRGIAELPLAKPGNPPITPL